MCDSLRELGDEGRAIVEQRILAGQLAERARHEHAAEDARHRGLGQHAQHEHQHEERGVALEARVGPCAGKVRRHDAECGREPKIGRRGADAACQI